MKGKNSIIELRPSSAAGNSVTVFLTRFWHSLGWIGGGMIDSHVSCARFYGYWSLSNFLNFHAPFTLHPLSLWHRFWLAIKSFKVFSTLGLCYFFWLLFSSATRKYVAFLSSARAPLSTCDARHLTVRRCPRRSWRGLPPVSSLLSLERLQVGVSLLVQNPLPAPRWNLFRVAASALFCSCASITGYLMMF